MKANDQIHNGVERALLSAGCSLFLLGGSAMGDEVRRFQFSEDGPVLGGSKVAPDDLYESNRGYGFLEEPGEDVTETRRFVLDLPEGNYDVALRLGRKDTATSTTIKAEARRLMLFDEETKPGEFVTRTFTVNVRRPQFGDSQKVGLNSREWGPPVHPSWDEQLSLEFNGESPGVVAMQIEPNPEATTVFLAGDSTVTDQRNEPWAGWGQMLPSFFAQGVAVSNHAESGLALFSFSGQRRLKKILSMMKKGDYLFIQFGHNDQKDRREGAGAFTTYKADLESYVEACRDAGGIPVLLTPMERRRWEGGKPQQTLTDYAESVRQVGGEMNVPVIDLHAMSLELYTALGEKDSTRAFVFYPANSFPDQRDALKDNTHHSPYGGYELARCVVEGIKASVPDLAKRLRADVEDFDPSKPDEPDKLVIPSSPIRGENMTPEGS